jgi:hypothetical protein
MAITKQQLQTLLFTPIKNSSDLIRPVGNDIILTASGSHIYLNGMHLINTEFIPLDFFKQYIEMVIQGKRKHSKKEHAE